MGATSQLNNIGICSFRLKLFCIVFQMLKPYNYCCECTKSNAWNFDMLKALIYTDVDICRGVKTDHRRRKQHTPKAIKLSGETAVLDQKCTHPSASDISVICLGRVSGCFPS